MGRLRGSGGEAGVGALAHETGERILLQSQKRLNGGFAADGVLVFCAGDLHPIERVEPGAIAGVGKRNQVAAHARQGLGDLELARRGVAAQIGARDRSGQQQARLLQLGLLGGGLANRRVEYRAVLFPEIELIGQDERIDEGHGLLQSALRRIVGGDDAMQRIARLPHAEGRLNLGQKPRAGDLHERVGCAQRVFGFSEALIVVQRLVDDGVEFGAAEGAPPFLMRPAGFVCGLETGSRERALHGRRAEKLRALQLSSWRAAGDEKQKKKESHRHALLSHACPMTSSADS